MELTFLDLRRYAIDTRLEIKLTEHDSGRVVVINTRGQARIPSDDRDFLVEDAIAAADRFEIMREKKPESLNRHQMASTIAEHFKKRGFAATTHADED